MKSKTLVLSLLFLNGMACTLTTTRPVQDMSDTAAAIRAAKRVGAETISPAYFRKAKESFFQARQEYRLKNFKEAKALSIQARKLAERAEFESIIKASENIDEGTDPLLNEANTPPPPPPNALEPPPPSEDASNQSPPPPTSEGVYVEAYEEKEKEKRDEELKRAREQQEKLGIPQPK